MHTGDRRRELAAQIEAERPRLVGLCARLSGDWAAAEDLAQEALLEAWRHADELHDLSGARPWLSAFARHICLRWRRSQGGERRLQPWPAGDEAGAAVSDGGEGAAALEQGLERAELALLLERALSHLPGDTRALLVGHYLEEQRLVALAARMGVSSDALAVRLHRARRELRRVFATELAHEAAPYGLAPAAPAPWQATRVWCPFCGRQTLEIALDREAGGVCFRCPRCRDGAPAQIARTPVAVPLHDLRSPKAILSRQIQWLDAHYQAALARQVTPCLGCGRQLAVALGAPPQIAPPHVAPRYALYYRCDACGALDVQPLSYMALDHPATQRFWRRHPRMRLLPPRELSYGGRPALRTTFESVDGATQLSVIADAGTFAVLALDEGPAAVAVSAAPARPDAQ
jgi:RNA polymerase sigma-70 factor (ECF subfamily)